jgi:hypothetical protein
VGKLTRDIACLFGGQYGFAVAFICSKAAHFARDDFIGLGNFVRLGGGSDDYVSHPRIAVGFNEQKFLFDNDLAMSKMNRGMLAEPTGDVDRDFVTIMIPQKQSAMEIARAELKYGHNEELRRLAQNIITQHEQEISVMRAAIGASPT